MIPKTIFIPILVQIALVLALYIRLAIVKSRASKGGKVDENRRALYADAWPESVLKVNNCIRNQFEVPALFYVLIFILWNTDEINVFVHVSSWIFVISRIIHAFVHTRTNYVPLRRSVFSIGVLAVLVLCLYTIAVIF